MSCPSWKRKLGFDLNLEMISRFLKLGTLSLFLDDFEDLVLEHLRQENTDDDTTKEKTKRLRSHVYFVWDLLCAVKRAHDVHMQRYGVRVLSTH